jgi:ketosteroid isomerase-like protein
VDDDWRELMLSGYDAISRGDIEGMLERVDPEIEVVTSGAFLDQGAVYRGHDGLRAFFAMLHDAFEELSYELLELEQLDDARVLAIVRVRGRGKGSGLEVDREGAHLWTVRGSTPVRLEAFPDRQSGRAAAGLT